MGGEGNDFLNGGIGDDNIDGGDGADDIFGGPGNDTISAGDGNDTIRGGADDDAMNGGVGIDWVDYSFSSTGVTVNLAAGTATGEGNDTLSGIENVAGTNSADTLIGDDNANVLDSSGGNDILRGGGGNDTLNAQAGHDQIDGGLGADAINLSGFVTTDVVIYNALNEGAAAGADTGFDSVNGFQTGADNVRFETNANTELDDITANDIFAFVTNASADFTTNHEALLRTEFANADLTEFDFATLLSNLNTLGVVAGAGDDGLIVAQGATQTGIYYYLEDGIAANAISATELSLLAIVNGQLGTGDFDLL
jgi:Ca2+-binding RTX toxin-like protein